MNSDEFKTEKAMNYKELVDYLLNKYGPATENYFINESCASKNKRVVRTDEGLICHHICENEHIQLSHQAIAKRHPFEYQLAKNLVYCNLLEHLLLHLSIANETKKKRNCIQLDTTSAYSMSDMLPLNGGFDYINVDCNELFLNNGSDKQYKQNYYEQIKDNFEDYTDLLAELVQVCADSFTGEKEKKEITLSAGQKIRSRSKGIGVIEGIENRFPSTEEKTFFENPRYQTIVVKFDDGIERIPRIYIDKGNYDKELDSIIDSLSMDGFNNICERVKSAINRKIKR